MNIRSWISGCPFKKGHEYRIKRDFVSLRDSFKKNEIVVFNYCAHSTYDGYHGFFFDVPNSGRLLTWDLPYNEDIEIWKDYFKAVEK